MRDGLLIGRGAVDMKGELAARAVAFAALARSGERPAGDVVLVSEADEERNTADVGMSWLVRERPDLACDFALNEGGGLLLTLADGRRVVTLDVGEKRVSSLRIRMFGDQAGHASVPAAADNPLRHVATAIDRLLDYPGAGAVRLRDRAGAGASSARPAATTTRSRAPARQHPVLADTLPVTGPDDRDPDRASRASSRAT